MSGRPAKTDAPRPIRLRDYRPPAFLVDRVDLDISLDPMRTRVRSRLRIRRNPKVAAHGPLKLDGSYLDLDEVRLDRTILTRNQFELDDQHLLIPRPPADPFTLETVTFVDPESNKALQGIYRSRGVYCSQCEAEGFRRITFFPDRPDVLATYTVRLEADPNEAPILLANGNPTERGTCDHGRRHYAIWKDPHPKPCYLFALVGGNLSPISSQFRTMSGRTVALNIYVEHGKEDRAVWAMDALKRAMRWDEVRFGREYDLDVFNIVAVSDFNMGAMENKGLNIFNDRLILASPETATDTMFEAIESVVAHEYFHNWTGNRITCRDWFQLCLKEGLTVFRDQEFSADERSPTVQRIADVRQLRATQFPEDAGPLSHPVRPESYIEVNNFYTATVYEKGAELVRMLRTILGEQTFTAGMDLYFQRHDGDAATVEDFIACFEEASGRTLSHFKLWYTERGTPHLVCSFDYDRSSRTARLRVDQLLPAAPRHAKVKPMHVPMKLGLIGANGRDLDLLLDDGRRIDDGVLTIDRASQTFTFAGLPARPVPSLLRGFSAPVNLTIDLADKDLDFLMVHDADLFNRWQAANSYATRILVQLASAMKAGKRSARGASYAKALASTLADTALQPAYRAELLKLPTQSDIAREIATEVDPGIIHRAHRQLSRLIGATLGPTLVGIYDDLMPRGAFSPDAASAGRRALRNAVLTLLVARGEDADADRLSRHYFSATNMTDQAHALALLAGSEHPDRQRALADFFDRWHRDHLVIDTWFAAQAQSPQPDTMERVYELTRHPLFALTAPNKVRALIGVFALQNPVQFNRPDGAGYEFVADQTLAIDRFNPQVAARLLGSFRSWRALEPGRRKHAKRVLQRVAKSPSLSRDVFEIVTKMLDA